MAINRLVMVGIHHSQTDGLLLQPYLTQKKQTSECTAQWTHDGIAGNDICRRPGDILSRQEMKGSVPFAFPFLGEAMAGRERTMTYRGPPQKWQDNFR